MYIRWFVSLGKWTDVPDNIVVQSNCICRRHKGKGKELATNANNISVDVNNSKYKAITDTGTTSHFLKLELI